MHERGTFRARCQNIHDFDLSKRLESIVEANEGFHFVQQNGQRIFKAIPEMRLANPPAGCEIFIGNIPKFMFEDELIPMFQSAAKLYRFRLMLDFNHRTRGYGFATYFSAHDASEAIAKFDGFEILPNVRLGVHKSLDNRRLFIGNVPKDKTRSEVTCSLTNYINGVVNVILYPSLESIEENRGFAFVEFESHLLASLARRQLHPRNLVIWDRSLYVDWAEPVPEVDPGVQQMIRVLYVKNLPIHYSNERISFTFQYVCKGLITKTHKIKNYAFVHCTDRQAAQQVMEMLLGLVLDDCKLDVEWARPRQYSNQSRALQPPMNFCLNVPLRSRRLVKQLVQSRKSSPPKSDSDSDQTSRQSDEK